MIFTGGFRVEFGEEEVEQLTSRIGYALCVGFEIDRGNGRAVLEGLVREAVHVRGPEDEIFADDEIRVYGPAGDG